MTRPLLAFIATFSLMACTPTEPPAVAAASAETQRAIERTGLIRRNDTPYTLWGPAVKVGDMAPVGTLRDNDNKPFSVNFADGTVRAVLMVPSLDTPTCSLETRTFNGRASDLGESVEVFVISRDLPAAQARFCGAMGIDRIITLSDFDDGGFGESWGLMVKETRLLARAVGVVDGSGRITYLEIVENIPDEPDYDKAIAALAELVPPSPAAESDGEAADDESEPSPDE